LFEAFLRNVVDGGWPFPNQTQAAQSLAAEAVA
jgi:hypothetical protein